MNLLFGGLKQHKLSYDSGGWKFRISFSGCARCKIKVSAWPGPVEALRGECLAFLEAACIP